MGVPKYLEMGTLHVGQDGSVHEQHDSEDHRARHPWPYMFNKESASLRYKT